MCMRGEASLVAALAGSVLLTPRAGAVGFYEPLRPPRPFQVMVHRGAMGQAPENTRAALERVIEDQLEWAEVDVRLTADGQHVIWHDSTVDGKTDGTGSVEKLTLAAIKTLDAGSWFAHRFAGERILSLGECLAIAKGRCNLYLDCKHVNPERLVREILAGGMERQVVAYGTTDLAASVRAASGGRVPIMTKWHPEYGTDAWVSKWRPDAVEIDAAEVSGDICRWFHQRGIRVEAKTLGDDDRPEVWNAALDAGADWLQTDLPEQVLAHRLWGTMNDRPVKIAFHRGANRYAPENTLSAFEKAIRMNADYVEIDVRTSRDGRQLLLHDRTLDRTTNGSGPIADQDAAATRALDAGAWFGAPYRGGRVPTLDEALETLRGRVGIYLDAKDVPPALLVATLQQAEVVDQTVVYSGEDYLQQLKAIDPGIRLLCPLDSLAHVGALAGRLHPYAFDVDWDILSDGLIRECHNRGIQVFSDAMGHEDIEQYQRAMSWGIDVIQTDHPLRVMRAAQLHANPK